ncbi:glutamyl-tRNA reductase [Ferviditalea candida]|uniref:Glutamyl-tRNA reductase n=1 Tax=Ferviditalea candida TaxID=3108399 RepID=A0ABU5ZD16_9BACL|nr:glutamyl-tRNA reductase [Paenibacillaceae bacterium T2]
MHIVAVGLNYRKAPVDIREKFTFSDESLPVALQQLKRTKSILECVILSTCNRTEIYAVVDQQQVCGHYIRSFLANWFQIEIGEFADYLTIYEDNEAIRHLFSVTAGLDSMVIGETQILGQVRNAFLLAQKHNATGTLFNMLFKQAITMAKKAHSETSIGENPVSVSYAAVELGKKIYGNFKNKNVMIIGAGKMSELTLKHLHANGVGKIVVANRTLQKAKELAGQFAGTFCSMGQLEEMLVEQDIDIVISSTGADGYVLTLEQMEPVMKKRKSKPLFMIDIAVPRDLDPRLMDMPNVYLYDIDDLEGIVESNLEQRKREAMKVDKLIEHELEMFHQWYRLLGVGPVIGALQEKANRIHQETMSNMLQKLPDLTEREIKVIRKLSKSMLTQMLHDPIMRIKELSAGRRGVEELDLIRELFALEDMLKEQARLPKDFLLESKPSESDDDRISPVNPVLA